MRCSKDRENGWLNNSISLPILAVAGQYNARRSYIMWLNVLVLLCTCMQNWTECVQVCEMVHASVKNAAVA